MGNFSGRKNLALDEREGLALDDKVCLSSSKVRNRSSMTGNWHKEHTSVPQARKNRGKKEPAVHGLEIEKIVELESHRSEKEGE